MNKFFTKETYINTIKMVLYPVELVEGLVDEEKTDEGSKNVLGELSEMLHESRTLQQETFI